MAFPQQGFSQALPLSFAPVAPGTLTALAVALRDPEREGAGSRLKERSGQKGVSFPLSLIFKGAGAKSSVTSKRIRVQGGLWKQKSLAPPTLGQRRPTRTPIP